MQLTTLPANDLQPTQPAIQPSSQQSGKKSHRRRRECLTFEDRCQVHAFWSFFSCSSGTPMERFARALAITCDESWAAAKVRPGFRRLFAQLLRSYRDSGNRFPGPGVAGRGLHTTRMDSIRVEYEPGPAREPHKLHLGKPHLYPNWRLR